jgi:hypothetical protein
MSLSSRELENACPASLFSRQLFLSDTVGLFFAAIKKEAGKR